MTKADKIDKLIELEHPFEQAVTDILSGFQHDFDQLEEGTFPKDNIKNAISEMDAALRRQKDVRLGTLRGIYDQLDEPAIDALLSLHENGREQLLQKVMTDAHELKWKWANDAVALSPTMNAIITEAGVKWMVNNTEGEVADSIASQPLEDLKAGSTNTEPPRAA